MTTITVNRDYESLRQWIETLPRLFEEKQGQLLYHGRNEVRLFEIDGHRLVVKRFKRHDWLKRLVYTFFRENKAKRAYVNALRLLERGFTTPTPIAYMEIHHQRLLCQVYYICAYTDSLPIRPRLIEQKPFDKQLAIVYARYVASLHESGVLHRDLNPTNVLVDNNDHFELIDINRMRFYDGPVPKSECMENLTLFYWLTPAYRFILEEYARQRGWREADIAEAIRVKERHDKRWIRRKQITHLGKYEVLH